jgi:putative ABC transport system permease protein
MQKVGMSQEEVRGTIRSQILLVFFLPLLVAAVHTAFAFPILTRLLRTLFSADQMLFLGCMAGALAVFAVLYVVIYSLTARTYYKLVRRD